MATYFSDHFGADGTDDTTSVVGKRVASGVGDSRLRYKRAEVTVDLSGAGTANADVLRFAKFRSGIRINAMWLSNTAGGAGTIDIGLALAGNNHDGAELDDDLFASAIAITNANDRTEALLEAATLVGTDRGKRLWQMADKSGALAYSVDPMQEWDIIGKTDTGTTAATTFVLEILYTAGD